MKKKNYRNITLAALVVAVCFINAGSQAVRSRGVSPETCPDEVAWMGKYENGYYGFSIVIPSGRKAFWNSMRCVKDEKYGCVCMTDHGRSIMLSDESGIEAFAGFEMDPELSLAGREKDNVTFLKERKGVEQVSVLSSRQIRLRRVEARRFVVRFVAQGKTMIEDRIIALREGVEYYLTLNTPESRYQEDKREFEKVVASWRFIPRAR